MNFYPYPQWGRVLILLSLWAGHPIIAATKALHPIKILDLFPTQLAAGWGEVKHRAEKLRKMDDDEADTYLRDHYVSTVRGPGDKTYLVDGHHVALAALHAGFWQVWEKKQADWSDLSEKEFWSRMEKRGWTYLYDENGEGPYLPRDLPNDVRGLKNDRYRTLAWAVRKSGGFDKTEVSFAEFQWANFFRERVPLPNEDAESFDRALKKALVLARSEQAQDLPGFHGRSCQRSFPLLR